MNLPQIYNDELKKLLAKLELETNKTYEFHIKNYDDYEKNKIEKSVYIIGDVKERKVEIIIDHEDIKILTGTYQNLNEFEDKLDKFKNTYYTKKYGHIVGKSLYQYIIYALFLYDDKRTYTKIGEYKFINE